jgi:hypothetical protein
MKEAPRFTNSKSKRGRKHGSKAGAYDSSTVRNSRPVPVRSIVCPDCGAVEGQNCVKATGGEIKSTVHASRRRMAIRKMNAEREAEGTLAIPFFPDRTPGPLETDDESVPLCTYCDLRIVLDKHGRRVYHDNQGRNTRGSGFRMPCPGSGEKVT